MIFSPEEKKGNGKIIQKGDNYGVFVPVPRL